MVTVPRGIGVKLTLQFFVRQVAHALSKKKVGFKAPTPKTPLKGFAAYLVRDSNPLGSIETKAVSSSIFFTN
jgi:hypothetical protein